MSKKRTTDLALDGIALASSNGAGNHGRLIPNDRARSVRLGREE